MLRTCVLFCFVVCAFGGKIQINRPKVDSRIVGGDYAKIKDYYYQLSLRYFKLHVCGATIISENFALTAAQCTQGKHYEDFTLMAGSDNLNTGGTIYRVSQLIQHPKFLTDKKDYDISILRVEQSFIFGADVNAIGLPMQGDGVPENLEVDVSGWGGELPNDPDSDYLRQVVIHTIASKECNNSYGFITERMFCASDPKKGFCNTDMGGPLVSGKKLIGIASFQNGCALLDYPGVYTNVSAFRDWIDNETGLGSGKFKIH